jgi:hypothetical protein
MRVKLPSSLFVGGLTVVAILPSVRAPLPALSLDTRLGTYLYVGVLVVLVVGYILTERRENARREREQSQRDEAGQKRHADDMNATAEIGERLERELANLNSRFASMAPNMPAATAGSTASAAASAQRLKPGRTTFADISEKVNELSVAAKGAVQRCNAAALVIKDINSLMSDQTLTAEQKTTNAQERIVTYYAKAKASKAIQPAPPQAPGTAGPPLSESAS